MTFVDAIYRPASASIKVSALIYCFHTDEKVTAQSWQRWGCSYIYLFHAFHSFQAQFGSSAAAAPAVLKCELYTCAVIYCLYLICLQTEMILLLFYLANSEFVKDGEYPL